MRDASANFSRFLVTLSLIICFSFSSGVDAAELYPFIQERQAAQFNHLIKQLRCLVCQNQDLADSDASLAKDLREKIYQHVKEGKSDKEIIHFLSERYGDFILFEPPLKSLTLLLWFGPTLFLFLGFFIFWRTCLKRNNYE